MCGISAIISTTKSTLTDLRSMNIAIRHRGPDDEGFFISENGQSSIYYGDETPNDVVKSGFIQSPKLNVNKNLNKKFSVGLAHRRLSILDLSPAGHMPFCDVNKRYWITYNGEIYNYIEIRDELKALGHQFYTSSDTEVLLNSYIHWGEDCLHRFNGMWAFVIYDTLEDTIFTARDRFGVKPLYYWLSEDKTIHLFSEIKQITSLPYWSSNLNKERALDFLIYSQMDHTDETLFKGVFQIPPGHFAILTKERKISYPKIETQQWYYLNEKGVNIDYKTAKINFKSLFFDAVKLRMRSDVSLGTCLSGGLDSSAIVCTIDKIKDEKSIQKTFSALSESEKYNEKKWVDIVVQNTKVQGFTTSPTFENFKESTEKLHWHQDEPYLSNSLVMQWEVFKLASNQKVKVMLDGQGADEQLGGYTGFIIYHMLYLLRTFKWNQLIREFRGANKYHGWSYGNSILSVLKFAVPQRIKGIFKKISNTEIPDWVNISIFKEVKIQHPFEGLNLKNHSVRSTSVGQVKAVNLQKLLHWEDRNSMAHSIESRVPFLDYRFVQFNISMPDSYKINEGRTKYILRTSMEGVLPDEIINRHDKIGFISPEEYWLKNKHTEYFRDLLKRAVIDSKGIVNENILEKFENIVLGKEPFDLTIWRVISFSIWLKMFDVKIN